MEQQTVFRLHRIRVENWRRIRLIDIEPGEGLTVVAGKNDAGKTSLLRAIWETLAGAATMSPETIRKGEKKATTTIELEERVQGSDEVLGRWTATRSVTPKGTYLRVQPADGEQIRAPQEWLDAMLNRLAFDPIHFQGLAPAKQLEELKKVLGDHAHTIDGIVARRKEAYEERTGMNAAARKARERVESIEADPDAPEQVVSMEEATGALKVAHDLVGRRARYRDQMTRYNETAESHDAAAEREVARARKALIDADQVVVKWKAGLKEATEKAEHARGLIETAGNEDRDGAARYRVDAQKIRDALETSAPPDTDAAANRLKNLQALNHRAAKQQEKRQAAEEARDCEANAKGMTVQIEQLDRDKIAVFEAAKLPVRGLGVDEDGALTVDGLPFAECGAAKKLRIAIAIAVASQPRLRLVLLKDAAYLDDDAVAHVARMADELGFHVLLETPSKRGAYAHLVIDDGQGRLEAGE